MQSTLRYADDHWANDPNPESALNKSKALGGHIVNRVECELFASLLPARMDGMSVLDFGCGCGSFTVLCAQRGATVLGIDVSPHALEAARLFAAQEGVADRCRFEVGTQVQGAGFDLVLAKDVLEHLPNDGEWVGAVRRALKPNGRLIFSTQNQWSLNYLIEGAYHRLWRKDPRWMGWDPTHVRFYTPVSLTRVFKANGLGIERWASMWIVPYNILSWMSLLKADVMLPGLRYVDYLLGKVFPFNRSGWVLMGACRRVD